MVLTIPAAARRPPDRGAAHRGAVEAPAGPCPDRAADQRRAASRRVAAPAGPSPPPRPPPVRGAARRRGAARGLPEPSGRRALPVRVPSQLCGRAVSTRPPGRTLEEALTPPTWAWRRPRRCSTRPAGQVAQGDHPARRADRRPGGRVPPAPRPGDTTLRFDAHPDAPDVWLFVGVNGVGKTTTIGKVAMRERRGPQGRDGRRATRSGPRLPTSLASGPTGAPGSSGATRAATPAPSCSTRCSTPPPEAPTWSWPTPPGGCTPRSI